jgi:hypothetical protein
VGLECRHPWPHQDRMPAGVGPVLLTPQGSTCAEFTPPQKTVCPAINTYCSTPRLIRGN